MKRLPWVKYWYADWSGDMGIQQASLEARGAWHETLCLLWHEGCFEHSGTPEEWARLWRCRYDSVTEILDEIERLKIADVQKNGNGVVTLRSRRLYREAKAREDTRLRVAKHRGNDAVTPNVTVSVTHDVTPHVTDRGQEAKKLRGLEVQKPEEKTFEQDKPARLSDEEWKQIWKAYPRKLGKAKAHDYCKALVKGGVEPDTLLAAAMNYATYMRGKEPQYIAHGSTFFGPSKKWMDFTNGVPQEEKQPEGDPDIPEWAANPPVPESTLAVPAVVKQLEKDLPNE